MAVSLNFRTALSGFHKEDVVHYIEYMNSKHTAQVNQLSSENEELRRRLEQGSSSPVQSDDIEALTAQLEELSAKCAALEQENQQLRAQAETVTSDAEKDVPSQSEEEAKNLVCKELEAYRRAEQAERSAKLRAEQIYQQATGTLAQATAQVDEAAAQYTQIVDRVSAQLEQLQTAVEQSKNALADAAAAMYAIRPEDPQE